MQSKGRDFVAINVCVPSFSLENVDIHHMYAGKVPVIEEESVYRGIMFLGDFIADLDSRFF